MHWPVFHHCDQMPGVYNLKKEMVSPPHGFRCFTSGLAGSREHHGGWGRGQGLGIDSKVTLA